MRHCAKWLPLMLAALLWLGGCGPESRIDPNILADETVGLRIDGQVRFAYDPATCQLGFNSSLNQFRAGNDTGTEYFTLTCEKLPSEIGQTVKADLVLIRNGSILRESGLVFTVEQVRDEKVWLWHAAKKIAVCVRIIR